MEIVKRPHARNMVRWAADKPEVLVLSADLTSSCEANDFREAYPDRFFSLGMAEQNMISFAGGMAREGFYPFVHTFAVFVCRRPFDQVAMSIAYSNLPVRLIGFLPGLTTPGGATHQAIDDLALMRVLPNMTILECGDATEVEASLDAAHAVDGPVYVRMLRGEVPRLFPPGEDPAVGETRQLSRGDDLTVISSGICTEEGSRAIRVLEKRGLSISHLHVNRIKPLDPAPLLDAIEGSRLGAIALENHSVIGGLGSAVAEAMAEAGSGRKLVRLGVQDVYAHGASRPYLMREYGIDAAALVRAVEDLVGRNLDVDDEELAAVELETAGRGSEMEDL
jgi:transketolase